MDYDTFTTLLGGFMVYSWVHLGFILHTGTPFNKRTGYEKFITLAAITLGVLFIIGLLIG